MVLSLVILGLADRLRAVCFVVPLAAVLRQQLRVVRGSKLPIPVGDLHRSARQALFDIDAPAVNAHKPALVRLPGHAAEGAVQSRGIDFAPLRLVEHFEWGTLLVIAPAVCEVRQPVMVADQFAVVFNGGVNDRASGPPIFAHPGLDAELSFDQILPWRTMARSGVYGSRGYSEAENRPGIPSLRNWRSQRATVE